MGVGNLILFTGVQDQSMRFSCPICNRSVKHKRNLYTHMLDQHPVRQQVWACDQCTAQCPTWSALRMHKRRQHSGGDF